MKRNSGVALIVVMVALAFMAIVVVEIAAVSRIDLRIALNARNRLQAHYLAVSAAKLQILRLHMYKEVKNLADGNQNMPIPKDMIDRIWNAPIPPLPLSNPENKWPGTMTASIRSEGSKIPINLLDGNKYRGSSEEIKEEVKRQLEELILGLLETEEFDAKYRGLEPKDLIHPLIDWIDEDSVKQEGGDEDRDYERLDPPYKPRNDRLPSMSELHLIQGWTDDIIRRLGPSLSTLNNSTKVNPNYISLERLRAWGPRLTEQELAYIDQKRRLTPFASMEALESFVRSDPEIRGGDNFTVPESLKKEGSLSSREEVFMIEASGSVGDTRRNIRMGVIMLSERPPRRQQGQGEGGAGGSAEEPEGEGAGDTPAKVGKLIEPQVVFVEEYL
jgi:general secretion pathway protein K